jgi:hypothetical protein
LQNSGSQAENLDEHENRIQKKLGIEFKEEFNLNYIPCVCSSFDLQAGIKLNFNSCHELHCLERAAGFFLASQRVPKRQKQIEDFPVPAKQAR